MTDRRPTGFLLDRRGIALPLVLMLTVFLTISVGAGFVIAGNEHTVGVDHDAQLKAFAVAQEGVERYLTDVTAVPATLPDVRAITVTGGTDTVTMREIRGGASPIYSITSVGYATASNLRRSAQTPVAQRTISQFVIWQSGVINSDAAFTSLAGINTKNGVSGKVSGINVPDPVTSCAGGGPAIPGLAVPDGSLNANGNSTNWIDGNPDNTPVYIGSPGPSGTAKDSVNIDWAGILAGSVAPDFVLDRTGKKSTGSWPSDYSSWPVVLVKGDITSGDNLKGNGGQGVLIVTGNAAFSNFTWHGIVLVGGTVTNSGSGAAVWGSLFSGLNVELGQSVPSADIGNGNVLVQYNSCNVSEALSDFGGWRRIQNSWSDNWPSYTVP
jgi:hypothetical protein